MFCNAFRIGIVNESKLPVAKKVNPFVCTRSNKLSILKACSENLVGSSTVPRKILCKLVPVLASSCAKNVFLNRTNTYHNTLFHMIFQNFVVTDYKVYQYRHHTYYLFHIPLKVHLLSYNFLQLFLNYHIHLDI